MKTLIFVLIFISVLVSPGYSQTQLLKVGNAAGFGNGWSQSFLDITVDKVTINGKQYLKRKLGWSHPLSEYRVSYERIDGDSAYYVLSSTNTDSLAFNFNWPVGTVTFSNNGGNNTIYEGRIDSIDFSSFLIPQDTLYHIIFYSIDLATGDTTYGIGAYMGTIHSKKLGRFDYGIFIHIQGAKIDGVRYGDIMSYPEEIIFSADSLYSEFIGDTVNCFIENTSDYPVVLDTIYTSSNYGYLTFLIKNNDYFYIPLYVQFPRDPCDSLNYIIPPHSSIQFQIFGIDLCPICDYEVQEYFQDTLRFVFSFNGYDYHFSNSISISGEGHMSDVEEEGVFPGEFILEQNYPNPFNPSTKISWQSPVSSWQSLKIFDVLGNEIAILVSEEKPAGNYEVSFDASKLSSGVYYYQLRAGEFVETKKMILLK